MTPWHSVLCCGSLFMAAMVPRLSSISMKMGLSEAEPCQVVTVKEAVWPESWKV